jgi:hypothetical protein
MRLFIGLPSLSAIATRVLASGLLTRIGGKGRILDTIYRTLAVVIALALLAPTTRAAAVQGSETLEYSVKAAYLYKFGGFVEWPAAAFQTAESPTTLCVVGNDPFGSALDKAVDGQRIADRPISVKRLQSVGPNSGCQIIFISGPDEQKNSQILAQVRGEGVLTITDGARSPKATGIINFVIAENRVRFEIDDQAAAANGVVISSKLLDLARAAKRRG